MISFLEKCLIAFAIGLGLGYLRQIATKTKKCTKKKAKKRGDSEWVANMKK